MLPVVSLQETRVSQSHFDPKSDGDLSVALADLEVRAHQQETELRRLKWWGLIAVVMLTAVVGWLCFWQNLGILAGHFVTPPPVVFAPPMLPAPPAPLPDLRDVPMAVIDLAPGTVIDPLHLGIGKVIAAEVQDTVLHFERDLVGKRVKTWIEAATPIRSEQLEHINTNDGTETSPDE